MKDFNKELRKFSPKERRIIERLIEKIIKRDLAGLDCKKLKGLKNFFRVRKGDIRIIFELKNDKEEPNIFAIERRRENTYKF